MSSALYNAVTAALTGPNYLEWAQSMQSFLMAQGQWHVIVTSPPAATEADALKAFQADDLRAQGYIRLRIAPTIITAIQTKTSAADMWTHLKDTYGKPGVPVIYQDFRAAVGLTIPADSNPIPAGYIPAPNKGQAKPELRSRFQTVIGSLLFLMLGTRPDLAFAVTKLAQFASNPSDEHLDRALYICRYLVGTKDYSLVYNGASQTGIVAGTDLDWASDPHSRRSQTGYFLKLANGIFS